MNDKKIIRIIYINTYGQTKFTVQKQLQIDDIAKKYKSDIIHLQESHMDSESFQQCSFIKNNFRLLYNNSPSGYGTASIVHNDLNVENEFYDTNGRLIVFDIGNTTFGNVYLEAGTDGPSRAARENYCGEVIPNLLVNRCSAGCIGGDWNSIINKNDATNNAASKMSPNLARLSKTFKWSDSFKVKVPDVSCYSHYYKQGATRIDREYHWGEIVIKKAEYIPLAFSDHLGLLTEIEVPFIIERSCQIYGSSSFKIRNNVACDSFFKTSVASSMIKWKEMKEFGLDTLTWWELVVKPGIRKIAEARSREMKKERRGQLNMLFIRQAYFVKKLQKNNCVTLHTGLNLTKSLICDWYEEESKKIQIQSRREEFAPSEVTRIYHHELHQQYIRRSSIVKLETEDGLLEGHNKCSEYLHKSVRQLLCCPAVLDGTSQNELLSLVSPVFSSDDNDMLETMPSKKEVLHALSSSNLNASAGSDGISSLVYKECWESLGDCLLEVIKSLFMGAPPTTSMRTAMMNFCCKPKKPNSVKPSDKRRISILNCDFKLYEGLIARRFRKIGYRVLSPLQYVAGRNRTIHHGIARARDAIEAASLSNTACGIGDQDYVAAFDYLVLSWVWQVLQFKGVHESTIRRLRTLYSNGITVPIVNNTHMPAVNDIRGSLRQGGSGSMEWFAFGIDPLLIYLEKNLTGILISSIPLEGPANEGESFPLPLHEERFKAMAFCDDVKPAICSINEFLIADKGAALFEAAAGTKLHRDPMSNKCKFLPLGKWCSKLKQEDIPTPYMRLTDTLDMVGVQLCSKWSKTRQKNGETLKLKVSNLLGSWRSGKFMPLTLRPWSANTFALSKVWFRCASVNLREADFAAINSNIKKWMYADLLLKPEEIVLFRSVWCGGLGLISVKHKSVAYLIKTFLELATNPNYIQSQFLSLLYRVHILQEDIYCPPTPPYYSNYFFDHILRAKNSGLNIVNMTTRQWYNYLVNYDLLKMEMDDGTEVYRPCRAERLSPHIDWSTTWKRIRFPFLSSNTMTFLWKLMHKLLPSEERLSSTLGNISPHCQLGCPDNTEANLEHCFFSCLLTYEVGAWLLDTVHIFVPNANAQSVLNLDLPANNALIWIVANTLYFVWAKRSSKKKVSLISCLTHLRSEAIRLEETHHRQLPTCILGMLDTQNE